MNELLFFATFLFTLALALLAFRLGKSYVFAFIATIGCIAIFVAPMVTTLFGFAIVLFEIFYAVIFFTTDLISEHYGKKEARSLVWLAVLVLVTVSVISALAVMFVPHAVDTIQPHVKAILEISPRLIMATFLMFVIEQHFDIWFFHKLREKTKGGKLWLRNILSTSTSQLIDVLIFYPLAFYGIYENLLELMVAAYIFKVLMAFLDTPFIYLSRRFKPKELG
ncbi:queuosine precursor transporter [Candidatus Peregrinibacteria bacterium]|nr:queuosine precursor transporter [Candidatus Peregrinibacteria bacterium]